MLRLGTARSTILCIFPLLCLYQVVLQQYSETRLEVDPLAIPSSTQPLSSASSFSSPSSWSSFVRLFAKENNTSSSLSSRSAGTSSLATLSQLFSKNNDNGNHHHPQAGAVDLSDSSLWWLGPEEQQQQQQQNNNNDNCDYGSKLNLNNHPNYPPQHSNKYENKNNRTFVLDDPWTHRRLYNRTLFESWFTPVVMKNQNIPNVQDNPVLQQLQQRRGGGGKKGRMQKRKQNGIANNNETKIKYVLKPGADAEGPILDFIVAGWPKCGTTTLEANLAKHYAPMPVADICTPIHQTVWYAYHNWPQKHDAAHNHSVNNTFDANSTATNNNTTTTTTPKLLRGTKCPRYASQMNMIGKFLPRAKIILGIRHPVLWFQSFWNMLAHNDRRYLKMSSMSKAKPCVKGHPCSDHCPNHQLFCVHRSAFHLHLASLGKTNLTDDERQYLSPHMHYGGHSVANFNVANPIFLYEQTQLSQEYLWDELADFLNLPSIQHDRYMSSHGRNSPWADRATVNICDARHDELRQVIMPIAYKLSVWLTDYFVHVAADPYRPDVRVPNTTAFASIVESYRRDPCQRLIRSNSGKYELKMELRLEQQQQPQNSTI